jgi:hypothetical protein
MNQDDVREFLTVCLMCGDGVPAVTNLDNPDLVYQAIKSSIRGWHMFGYCRDEGLLSDEVPNASGEGVYYVTQKGKDLLL